MDSEILPRILLVDDHRDTVELTAFLPIKRGYRVIPAHSTAEDRDAAAKHQCDVLMLADGNGIGLVRELQKQYDVMCVLVSGAIHDAETIEAEGFKFLAKPVDLKRLVDGLDSLTPA